MIVKSEAVVLRTMKYRDTSRIVTFYTREFGKLGGIVKGARDAKNKYGSSLQPTSHVSLVVYKKAGRDLQTVTQCDLLKSFRHVHEDLDKMAAGMTMIELVNIIAHEEEENIPLFTLLVDSLAAVNHATKHPLALLYNFEIRLAGILGFQPLFNSCISCHERIVGEKVIYHLMKGGPVCRNCPSVPGQTMTVLYRTLKLLQKISEAETFDELPEIEAGPASKEIDSLLWSFLKLHVSGMRALKTERVFSKILDLS